MPALTLMVIALIATCQTRLLGQGPDESEQLLSELGCVVCHTDLDTPTTIRRQAPSLSPVRPYQPGRLLDYLQNPRRIRQDIGNARMPDFRFNEKEALALTLFLTASSAGPEQSGRVISDSSFAQHYQARERDHSGELDEAYSLAKTSFPGVTSLLGEEIFLAQNCIACHSHGQRQSPHQMLAPGLSDEGNRVQEGWLRTFLEQSFSIRPFGFHPGTGSRMPDFRLTGDEARLLGDFLMTQKKPREHRTGYEPARLSTFSMRKAEKIFREKLSCMGCHRIGEEGGKVGPDLSKVSGRLLPSYVFNIVEDPQGTVQGTVMPKVLMPAGQRELIVNYLLQLSETREDSTYLSLADHPITLVEGLPPAEQNYSRFCAPCHGEGGDGQGYNIAYLPARPTAHRDSEYMATRTDAALYNGAAAGGYILNKSHAMPPWGDTLSRRELTGLVSYMRELCECEGPAWSRDGK
jgi:mono/diheme cytochrome c family protein